MGLCHLWDAECKGAGYLALTVLGYEVYQQMSVGWIVLGATGLEGTTIAGQNLLLGDSLM